MNFTNIFVANETWDFSGFYNFKGMSKYEAFSFPDFLFCFPHIRVSRCIVTNISKNTSWYWHWRRHWWIISLYFSKECLVIRTWWWWSWKKKLQSVVNVFAWIFLHALVELEHDRLFFFYQGHVKHRKFELQIH